MPFRSLVLLVVALVVSLTATWAQEEASPTGNPPSGVSSSTEGPAKAVTPAAKRSPHKKTQPRAAGKKRNAAAKKKAKKPLSLRARRVQKAFVASADLKFMAAQLLQDRSRAAYSGVESYARRHAHDEAGGLAWLVLGYAHSIDNQYGPAIDALRQAQPRADELSDYADYFLGQAYVSLHSYADAAKTVHDFRARHPESLYIRDAALVEAQALLGMNQPDKAAEVLEANRLPARADVETLLGRAYADAHNDAKAVEAWRTVYYGFALSPQADEVDSQLKAATQRAGIPPVKWEQRKARADQLARARRWSDAATEYRNLLSDTPGPQLASVQIALGDALYHAGREHDSRDVLERVPESADGYIDVLHDLAEMARDSDQNRFLQLLDKMRQVGPTSQALQETLLGTGNTYLLQRNYSEALKFYQEIYQRAPQGKLAPYAHWKTAWLTYRLGQMPEAARLFEEQVALYPGSNEAPDAIYWRARLLEQSGESTRARDWYVKLVQRFPLYYYAELARDRIRDLRLQPATATTPDPLLEKIPAITAPQGFDATLPPEDPRAEKAMLLENCGMFDFAVKELQAAMSQGGSNWAAPEIARVYQDSERDFRALQFLKRAVPNYYALDLGALPKNVWEALFPRVYWSDVKRFSEQNKLDPYLVSSLIRQESEFNPAAYSRANAIGLMQLLPKVGHTLARQVKIRHYSTNMLLEPTINIQLGTRYFAQLLDRYNGVLEYSLAAYNAGSDRVDDWRGAGPYRDTAEFVESIPFTETREYVQAILRNASVYRRLYAGEQSAKLR